MDTTSGVVEGQLSESEADSNSESGSESDDTKAEIALWQEKECPNCGVSMKLCPDEIEWSQVWRRMVRNVDNGDNGESGDSSNESDYGQDPCDDCCCGSCGKRKRWPGESHC